MNRAGICTVRQYFISLLRHSGLHVYSVVMNAKYPAAGDSAYGGGRKTHGNALESSQFSQTVQPDTDTDGVQPDTEFSQTQTLKFSQTQTLKFSQTQTLKFSQTQTPSSARRRSCLD